MKANQEDVLIVEGHNMSRKGTNNGKLWKTFTDRIQYLVEDIDRRTALEKENKEADSETMKKYYVRTNKDGSRTFSSERKNESTKSNHINTEQRM